MRGRSQETRWWETGGRKRGKTPSDWLAVVDQHHRMVHALSMAAPVHPPQEQEEQ